MEAIGRQILQLLWGAFPTMVIVFVVFFFLRWAFWRPLERVLAERETATGGTRRIAEVVGVVAVDRSREYEEALRQTRAAIYREQEVSHRQALEERSRIVNTARQQAVEMVQQAKLDLSRDVESAKKELDSESQRLAEEIARTLLAPARGSQPGGRRA